MGKQKNQTTLKPADHILAKERRKFIRQAVNFPLTYRVVGSRNGEEKSKTVNVGRGGLLFTARHPAKELSTVMIKIPFRNKVFAVKGKVAHCRFSLAKRLYEIGINFYTVSDAFKTKLIEQLYLINEFRDLRTRQLGRVVSAEEAAQEWIKRYSKRFRRLYW
jgi:hypothetical protein